MYKQDLKLNSSNSQRSKAPRHVEVIEGCKPFLKWAGGKTQMIDELLKYVPINFNKYIEPFIGGGAYFFALNHSKSIIADLNEDLVHTYLEVRDNVEEVVSILRTYKNEEAFYYKIRSKDITEMSTTERAARLIYLNKTCFNGLYRVNKQGRYNVPYGKRTNAFLNEGSIFAASEYLQGTKIYHSDYKNLLNKYAKKGDFIFLDPPYQPVGKNSDFKRYTKEFFYETDQIELAELFQNLVDRGCYVVLTNSEHPFILDLYKNFEIKIIDTKRMISSNPKTRTSTDIIVLGGM